jgi:protein SCO1/2
VRGTRGPLAAGLAAAALALGAPGPLDAAPERPALLRDVGFAPQLGAAVPRDLAFRDEQGRQVRLGDYLGARPILLVPAYYECPMLCTLVLQGVVSALRALPFDVGEAFHVVVFSFDPGETSALAAGKKAALLREYRRPGAGTGWHLLTGTEEAIRRLTDAIGFRYAYDAARGEYAHASGVVVLTPAGRVSHYFHGVEYAPRDLRLALVEASEERLGSVVDQLLLFCFRYDPATGRYGRLALGAVRVGGVATLLGLGAFVVLMLRREAGRRGAGAA